MQRQVSTQKILVSPAATRGFGRTFAQRLRPGDVVVLEGSLGSGKTTFVKGVAAGLGFGNPVTSPTFVIRKRYALSRLNRGITAINHVDAYRLGTVKELRGVLDDWMGERTTDVWFVEWGNRLASALAGRRTFCILFTHRSQSSRTAEISILRPRRN